MASTIEISGGGEDDTNAQRADESAPIASPAQRGKPHHAELGGRRKVVRRGDGPDFDRHVPAPQQEGEDASPSGEQDFGEEEVLAQALEMAASYSGPLPMPSDWQQYDADTRERILRTLEAGTTDESVRRDKIMDMMVKETSAGRHNAFCLAVFCLVLAAVAMFGFENNIGAGIFLSLPVLNLVGSFMRRG